MAKDQLSLIKKTIQELIRHEKVIGFLYERFSYKFPKIELWVNLSKDEKNHAQILKNLAESADFKKISINPSVFDEKAVKKSTNQILKLTKNYRKYNLAQALTVAYKLESTLVEHNFFSMFYSDDPKFTRVFKALEKYTDHHAKKIFIEIGKVK